MIYRFLTDLHIGTPIGLDNLYPYLALNSEEISKQNLYYLGDNIDLKRCKESQLSMLIKDLMNIRKAFIGRYVSGNHELTLGNLYQIIDQRILITHGDYVMWGEQKSFAFRSLKPGQGYGLVSRLVQIFRSSHVSANDAQKLAEFALKHHCYTIICGHVHPSVRFDKVVAGVRVIVLPRGFSEVEI